MKTLPCVNTILINNYLGSRDDLLDEAGREFNERVEQLIDQMTSHEGSMVELEHDYELFADWGDEICELIAAAASGKPVHDMAVQLVRSMAERIATGEL